jgi:tetratricopeptide (TPR) repeat protein
MAMFWVTAAGQCAASPRLVLVFPLENLSASSDVGWLSEGIADLIGQRLKSPSNYVLSRRERNTAFEQLGFPPGTPLTLASEYKSAEAMGVQEAVIGNFKIVADQLTTQVQVLDARHLRLSPPVTVTGNLVNLVGLETELAWRLRAFYDRGATTGSEAAFASRFHPIRLDAFENYFRGILAKDPPTRLHFLKEADRLDPPDHRAAFELGRDYFKEKDYAASAAWLEKLNPADAGYSESRFVLGVDDFFLGHYSESQKLFQQLARSIPLDAVFNNLGVLKARQDQYGEALADFERAHEGDPTDPDFSFNIAVCAWYLKKYSLAARSLKADLKVENDDADARSLLAAVLGEVGDQKGRRKELDWLTAHGEDSQAEAAADFLPLSRVKTTYDGHAFLLLKLAIQAAKQRKISRLSDRGRGAASGSGR